MNVPHDIQSCGSKGNQPASGIYDGRFLYIVKTEHCVRLPADALSLPLIFLTLTTLILAVQLFFFLSPCWWSHAQLHGKCQHAENPHAQLHGKRQRAENLNAKCTGSVSTLRIQMHNCTGSVSTLRIQMHSCTGSVSALRIQMHSCTGSVCTLIVACMQKNIQNWSWHTYLIIKREFRENISTTCNKFSDFRFADSWKFFIQVTKYSLKLQYFCARGFSARWVSNCMCARRVSARWESKCMYARRVSAHWDNWNQCTFVYQQKIMHINTTSTSTWSHVQSYLNVSSIFENVILLKIVLLTKYEFLYRTIVILFCFDN